jgi:hypothetical protein
VRTEVSREIARICALPQAARQQEVDSVKHDSGDGDRVPEALKRDK